MCLSTVWTDEEMEAWLAEQPEVIEVWKVVFDEGSHIQSSRFLWTDAPNKQPEHYKDGFTIARNPQIKASNGQIYSAGYHCFAHKEDADWLINNMPYQSARLKILIKKEWVEHIGFDYDKLCWVIVCDCAIFPHYPETEARYEDIKPFLEKKAEVKDEVPAV